MAQGMLYQNLGCVAKLEGMTKKEIKDTCAFYHSQMLTLDNGTVKATDKLNQMFKTSMI